MGSIAGINFVLVLPCIYILFNFCFMNKYHLCSEDWFLCSFTLIFILTKMHESSNQLNHCVNCVYSSTSLKISKKRCGMLLHFYLFCFTNSFFISRFSNGYFHVNFKSLLVKTMYQSYHLVC